MRIAKSLYQRGYSRQDILELLRLVEWMMTLPENLELDFQQELIRFEEESSMPYILSFERNAERNAERKASQARLEGILEKGREDVLEVLRIRFENLPSSLELVINQIEDDSVLKALHRQAVTIASLEEFEQLVAQLVSVDAPE